MIQARTLVDEHFGIFNGELHTGNMPVSEIVRVHGTPLFIYDSAILDKKWRLLRVTLPQEFSISYSVKANPNPAVIRHFLEKGCGLEIASGGELHIALKAGCSPQKMLFAGPGKTEGELELALTHGIGEIHIESLLEVERIGNICRRHGRRARVAVRVNPDSIAQGGAMRMGGKAVPFGIDEEHLDCVVDRITSYGLLDFRGLHFYLGTQILDYSVLIRQYRQVLRVAIRVADRMQKILQTIDFGGGLGIPYYAGEQPLDMIKFAEELRLLFLEIRDQPAFSGTQFVVEPGRYLVAEAGIYVAQVTDIKSSKGKKFLVVDGGMNHHLAASGNLGQVIKRNFPVAVLNRLTEQPQEIVDIVGPLCTPLDVLARDIELPRTEVGDLIGVFQSGAYARTASPLGFLSYPTPAEVLVEDGELRLIRRRGTYEDLLNDIPGDVS